MVSMRILAFSDLHEEEAALESLAKISIGYDHVFICGDFAQTQWFAGSVLDSFPNAFLIPGNWDSKIVNDLASRSKTWVHGKRVEIEDGLNVVGFGYSPPTPFGTYGELQEDEIYSRMSALDIDKDTLLMLHCPPKGHFDKVHLVRNIGSDAILRIINEKKPLAAFFGHVHEYAGTSKLGTTDLIKIPPANSMRACSVTIKDKRTSTEFISL
jgi:Icc-related predicted phosphoesterase